MESSAEFYQQESSYNTNFDTTGISTVGKWWNSALDSTLNAYHYATSGQAWDDFTAQPEGHEPFENGGRYTSGTGYEIGAEGWETIGEGAEFIADWVPVVGTVTRGTHAAICSAMGEDECAKEQAELAILNALLDGAASAVHGIGEGLSKVDRLTEETTLRDAENALQLEEDKVIERHLGAIKEIGETDSAMYRQIVSELDETGLAVLRDYEKHHPSNYQHFYTDAENAAHDELVQNKKSWSANEWASEQARQDEILSKYSMEPAATKDPVRDAGPIRNAGPVAEPLQPYSPADAISPTVVHEPHLTLTPWHEAPHAPRAQPEIPRAEGELPRVEGEAPHETPREEPREGQPKEEAPREETVTPEHVEEVRKKTVADHYKEIWSWRLDAQGLLYDLNGSPVDASDPYKTPQVTPELPFGEDPEVQFDPLDDPLDKLAKALNMSTTSLLGLLLAAGVATYRYYSK